MTKNCLYLLCFFLSNFVAHAWRDFKPCSADLAPSGGVLSVSAGIYGVPVGYSRDAVEFQKGYPEFFCSGEVEGCSCQASWLGISQSGWENVYELSSQMPRMQWEGKWWRGNDANVFIFSPFFYYQRLNGSDRLAISPLVNSLGITAKQHFALRPFYELIADLSDPLKHLKSKYMVRMAVFDLFRDARRKHRFEKIDLLIFIFKVQNLQVFGQRISREFAIRFLTVLAQTNRLHQQILVQPVEGYISDPLNAVRTREQFNEIVQFYRDLIVKKYYNVLKDEDCSPSFSCFDQAAYSIPGIFSVNINLIGNALWSAIGVTFSTDESNPAGYPLQVGRFQSLSLFWESIRFFSPVPVVPYWTPRHTCAGLVREETSKLNKDNGRSEPCPLGEPDLKTKLPAINQYAGGVKWLINLGMAMLDPSVWGENADKIFKLKPRWMYEKYSVAFFEAAKDSNVASGRMTRSCPGKAFALLIGKTFLQNFHRRQWRVSNTSAIKFKKAAPFVNDFELMWGNARPRIEF